MLGVPGIVLAVPGLLGSIADRPRGAALSGFLSGLGGVWLLVWARVTWACAEVDTATQGCVGPGLAGWWLLPLGLLVLGCLIGLAATRHRAPVAANPQQPSGGSDPA